MSYGHENGGWMNDDQRSAMKDKADKVEQLEADNTRLRAENDHMRHLLNAPMHQLKEERDRLRAEVERMKTDWKTCEDSWQTEIRNLRAENERLVESNNVLRRTREEQIKMMDKMEDLLAAKDAALEPLNRFEEEIWKEIRDKPHLVGEWCRKARKARLA